MCLIGGKVLLIIDIAKFAGHFLPVKFFNFIFTDELG